MKIGFATDIHLDHVKNTESLGKHKRLGAKLTKGLDHLVLGGDLSTGKELKKHMEAFKSDASCPIHFVLGNHDFWFAHEDSVWDDAKEIGGCLDYTDLVELNETTALVGLTGWYDTRAGDFQNYQIIMPEFETTTRLNGLGPIRAFRTYVWAPEKMHEAHNACKNWADEQTQKFLPKLEQAAKDYLNVYIVTHFPPWIEACWGKGGLSKERSPEWLPWSINLNLGMQIEALAEEFPEVNFEVLTGHTHFEGTAKVAFNINTHAGKARYGSPTIAKIFEV